MVSLKRSIVHPIFRTSQQVRCEALHIFFASTTWKISYLPLIVPFLNFIGPYCRASLRTLWIKYLFCQGMWTSYFVKILNGLCGLQKLYIDFTLEPLLRVSHVLTSPKLAFQTPELQPLLSLRGLTEVKLSFAPEASDGTDWADRERAFWAGGCAAILTYFKVPGLGSRYEDSQRAAMSFLQRFETEFQKTACLPREA